MLVRVVVGDCSAAMRLAVVGCSHGALTDIYASIQAASDAAVARGEAAVDCVLLCGDFQALRHGQDTLDMAVPDKYRALGQFHDYYAGRKKAPFVTIVIGGNHESSAYMRELANGGFLAPNIYFGGFAGVVRLGHRTRGPRVACASGIWNAKSFRMGHWEQTPFDKGSLRSVYHIREFDTARLLQLANSPAQGTRSVDVFMSHDWPQGIEHEGDLEALLRAKPFFKDDIRTGQLGSPPLRAILRALRPSFWFAAHLHVKFAALVHHDGSKTRVVPRGNQGGANPDEIALNDEEGEGNVEESTEKAENPDEIALESSDDDEVDETAPVESAKAHERQQANDDNPDEIALDDEDDGVPAPALATAAAASTSASGNGGAATTRFLALDKPGYRRHFFQVVDVVDEEGDVEWERDAEGRVRLFPDAHWLAIMRATDPYLPLSRAPARLPPAGKLQQELDEAAEWVTEHVGTQESVPPLDQVQTFQMTAPPTDDLGRSPDVPRACVSQLPTVL